MPVAHNGEVEIYYETFGEPEAPTLLLVNGLGSQCIFYEAEWCRRFAARGYRVVRFDNRDVGLSSKLPGVDYSLDDMARDALAVLDDLDVERAHGLGASMGGMIVQRLAIDHADRLLSMTSVMSTTGEREYGQASREALAVLLAPAPRSREEYIDLHCSGLEVYGSDSEWIDWPATRARYGAAFDRSFSPDGVGRQMRAVLADGSRADGLRKVSLPTLVLHGSRDRLINPDGGRRTAELVPGARYVEIEKMGHDYPPAVWDQWVDHWHELAREVTRRPVGRRPE